MRGLMGPIRACYNPSAPPVLVELTIETHGGKPSCVEQRPRSHPSARCVATAAARHLTIPDSPAEEACSIRYPIRFE
ncbi:MAG: hypothetical protein CMH55_08030 [Myxococcales bacterium]|nr:hypothetical protein [Myxococcales bacterium]